MGVNIKAIHARIKSVDSTKHITKAMELVASSKIRRAGRRMDASRFYRDTMLDAVSSLASEKSRYTESRDSSLPALYIVIAGDRGLAGGYNNNIFRSATAAMEHDDLVIPIGKRSVDYFSKRYHIVSDKYLSVENFTATDSIEIARLARDMYEKGEISEINLIYTRFISMLSQSPSIEYILPLRDKAQKNTGSAVIEYEPDPESVLAAVIPEYISGVLYSYVTESFASELASRRSAMDTATKNADEMLSQLSLSYNRARQGAITQEITEITAGTNV